jgi:hypothetical protein
MRRAPLRELSRSLTRSERIYFAALKSGWIFSELLARGAAENGRLESNKSVVPRT